MVYGMRWPTAALSWRLAATRSIPVGGRYAFRDMGMLSWDCVVASDHPLAKMEGPLSDDVLRNWPSLVREDTSRSLPKTDNMVAG